MRIEVPWGDASLALDLPDDWEIVRAANPSRLKAVESVELELERALSNPIGCAPLSNILRPEHRVACVVDDIGRPTPAFRLLPLILKRVASAGIPRENQTLVFATGLHRGLTEEEMVKKVGREVFQSVRCINHNAKDANNLLRLGTTSRGTPAIFNKGVAEADVRILVGTIEPHVQAGFGGGCKNLLPGVAAAESIGANHFLGADPEHFSMIGFAPDRNPMRQDLEEAALMLGGATFIVNTLLTPKLQVARILAGHPIQAHREGLSAVSHSYAVPLEQPADLVITNSYPLDVNLRQDVKSVANVLFAAKPNGTILALLRSRLGLDDVRIPSSRLGLPLEWIRTLLRAAPARAIRALSTSPRTGIAVEERFFLYFALQALKRNRIFVFSPTLASQVNGKLRGIPLSGDLDVAIREVKRRLPSRPRVVVFPEGGVTYPLMEGHA
ncbi:MAG: nickel-dependent lactate racemase [Nitrospirae bacterium]|nr:nickel-dependent lactate racemase [Nitrospirota bacterium]